ncbi:aspartic peptidase domain-containing protein [Trichoderma austrokoningii]
MRSSLQYALPAGLAAAGVVSAGTVSVFFEKRFPDSNPLPSLLRRDGTVSLDALNNITGGGYYAEFSVGTPPQKLSFMLDTGSSDTWVNSVDAYLCLDPIMQEELGEYCSKQFDQDKSKSFNSTGQPFNITYLDGRNILGHYFKDTVTINDATVIKNQQMGLGLQTVRGTGLIGLGFKANEAAAIKYPTVIENMVSQKIIAMPAFSLYLNDLQTSQGSILFGGVDTDKFHGGLATLPFQSLPASIATTQDIVMYAVQLNGFKVSGLNTPAVNATAVLDSGSTISLLPDDVVQDVWQQFGVKTIHILPIPLVDCGKANLKDTTFSFQFTNKTIQVPIDEMVIDNLGDAQEELIANFEQDFKGWSRICTFGMASTLDYGISSDQFVLLGDTFLRSAYVVYDLQNQQVGIAQATLNSTSSSIIEFQAGSKTIPGPVSTGSDDSSSDDDSSKGNAGVALHPAFSAAIAGTVVVTLSMIMSAL